MNKWTRGIPKEPGKYVCVVNEPRQGVVTMHVMINSHLDAIVDQKHINLKWITAYKTEESHR